MLTVSFFFFLFSFGFYFRGILHMECEVYCPRRLLRTGYGRFGGFWGGILICVVPMSQFCFSSSVFSAVKIHEGPSLVFVSFFFVY